MKKRKVLEIVSSLGIGGNPIFVMNYFRVLNKEKFQIDFLIFDDSRLDFKQEVCEAGSNVYVCSKENRNSLLGQMKYVYSFLKKNHYDVVHCHNCAFKGLLRGTVPAKLAGIDTIIAHSHSVGMPKNTVVDNVFRGFLKMLLCWSIDYGLACSDSTGESKYLKSFRNTSRYEIIRNAINIDKFRFNQGSREIIRNQYNIKDEIIIGNVGRLSFEKNQKKLIAVFDELLKTKKNVRLMIVGGGELEEELKKQVLDLGVTENVVFTGMLDNSSAYYSAMDVFVMPSFYEGFPFTVVEAQVNGLKCVMSDTITQMVNISGDVEFLSLQDSDEDWGEVIWNQAQNRSDDKKTKKVCEEYDLKLEVKKLEEYYLRKV